MNGATAALAALLTAPVLVLVGMRYLLLRRGMDRAARRRYLRRTAVFGLASLVVCASLFLYRGALALPVLWELLACLLAGALIAGILRRG